jgi:hypothetical protein
MSSPTCGTLEARTLMSEPSERLVPVAGDDFYEDDEPYEDVRAAFDAGEKGLTVSKPGSGDTAVLTTARPVMRWRVTPAAPDPGRSRRSDATATRGRPQA